MRVAELSKVGQFRQMVEMGHPTISTRTSFTICFTLPYARTRITGIGRFVDDLVAKMQEAQVGSIILAPSFERATVQNGSLRLRGGFLLNFQLAIATFVRILRVRRSFQIVHAQHAQMQSLSACIAARILGRPSVLTLHGRVPDPAGWLRRATKHLAELLSVRIATEVVAVSPHVAEQFSTIRARIEVIENGVDTKIFTRNEINRARIRSSMGIESKLTFVFAGRWAKSKGIDLLLEAIRTPKLASRPFILLIVGEADPRDLYESPNTIELLATRSQVRVIDPVLDSLPEILSAADVFVLPSLYEGMPLGLLEAMATGLPALVSDISVHRMIVKRSGCGWTFRSGDADDLSHVMDDILTNGVPDSFPAKARAAAERYNSLDDEVSRYLSVYYRLLDIPAKRTANPAIP